MSLINHLFICDPVEQWNMVSDTTVLLIREIQKRGHPVWFCRIEDLSIRDGELKIDAQKMFLDDSPQGYFIAEEAIHSINHFQIVHMRKNPPVDQAFYQALILMEMAKSNEENEILWINNPLSLMKYNEKMMIHHFPEYIPPTLISSNPRTIMEFLSEEGKIVAKPLYHCSGVGIEKIGFEDNEKKILEILEKYPEGIICQKYLASVETGGDARVMVINGRIIASMKRIPKEGNFLCNLDQGATCEPYAITGHEIQAVQNIAEYLIENEIYFAAVDMIGGKLCEINITSPGLVYQMNEMDDMEYQKIMQDEFEALYYSKYGK